MASGGRGDLEICDHTASTIPLSTGHATSPSVVEHLGRLRYLGSSVCALFPTWAVGLCVSCSPWICSSPHEGGVSHQTPACSGHREMVLGIVRLFIYFALGCPGMGVFSLPSPTRGHVLVSSDFRLDFPFLAQIRALAVAPSCLGDPLAMR